MSYYKKTKHFFISVILIASVFVFGSIYFGFSTLKTHTFFFLWPIIIISLIIFKENISKLLTILNQFIRGEKAEHNVKKILSELPDNFRILNDISLVKNKGNVDLVVIGPTGIWTIEVKSHDGLITYGQGELLRNHKLLEKDFLKQAWAEALSVRNYIVEKLNINIFVQPVVVFDSYGAKINFGFNKIEGVYIIGALWLKKLITEHSSTELSENLIIKLYETIHLSL